MVVEVPGISVMPRQVKDGPVDAKKFQTKVSFEEPIQFDLLDSSKPSEGNDELSNATEFIVVKDATDEWPAQPQFHTFYFVKYRSYEDTKLKAELDRADKDLQKKSQARFQILETLKAKRAERAQVIAQLKPLTEEDKRFRTVVDEKRKEMEPLHAALGKLRSSNNSVSEKGVGLCFSEEELDELIQGLHYRIQHESNTLVEEKKLLKDIKQLEGTREKVVANAALRAKIQDSLGKKEAIQDQVKLMSVDLDGVRKDQQSLRTKIKLMEEEKKAIDAEIASLSLELDEMSEKRSNSYENLIRLKKAREEANAPYYENRSLLNTAKEIAAKKDVKALESLSSGEVEKFMSQWTTNKAFREDYEKRVLPSLEGRQLSRDGRMKSPDEKPLIVVEPPTAAVQTEHLVEARGKPVKENLIDPVIVPKAETEGKKVSPESSDNDYYVGTNLKEVLKVEEVDAGKLKEMKREEEMKKNKLAIERKKKLAEKATLKAEAKNQKEAERKQKEKEKRAKKKAGLPPSDDISQGEQDPTDVVVAENGEHEASKPAEAPAAAAIKEPREKAKPRNISKGKQHPSKIYFPKRKKAQAYWKWAAPAIAVVGSALVLAVLIYYFSSGGGGGGGGGGLA